MLIGQYKILDKIGEGGMGVIYKAEHSTLEQIVAIKALPPSLSSNKEIRQRFIREAKIQAKISHPNIVNIHNFIEQEGNYYIIMEFVDGKTLDEIIKTSGLIPPDRCLKLFEQICAGIGYAHEKGIIHRDIKPSNIMVNSQDVVKIMDFGIAKIASDLNLTQAGLKVGTVCYMSPEQIKGQSADIPSDIYSLGITLFEMVTGKVPFSANSEYEVMKKIIESPPTSPKVYYPYIPVAMESSILKSISKSPKDRFQNINAFSFALKNYSHDADNNHSGNIKFANKNKFNILNLIDDIKKISKPLKWGLSAFLLVLVIVVLFYIAEDDIKSLASNPPDKNASNTIKQPTSLPGQTNYTPQKSSPGMNPEKTHSLPKPPEESKTDRKSAEQKRTNEKKIAIKNPGIGSDDTKAKREDTGKIKRDQIIRHDLRNAEKYKAAGKWDEALNLYERVLKNDKYNEEAKRGISDTKRKKEAYEGL